MTKLVPTLCNLKGIYSSQMSRPTMYYHVSILSKHVHRYLTEATGSPEYQLLHKIFGLDSNYDNLLIEHEPDAPRLILTGAHSTSVHDQV